jgi:hypothetical protein
LAGVGWLFAFAWARAVKAGFLLVKMQLEFCKNGSKSAIFGVNPKSQEKSGIIA